ncbi:MAG: selenide, water dikinase SelD [Nitrospirae bacterium]|nr:selenide, water dikinase SelD [Nitrospirota bacterium]MBF0533506.1 selenide, water dikinase SelD [Nitrospirota bacterium]MBF0615970.1 selenide, water dikinase SelD [Nitrospirota bacterium]
MSKLGPADLEDLIGSLGDSLQSGLRVKVLVGPGDDAGVYLIGDTAFVETVDFITPPVNDPYTFGAVSATNSLSDVYSMGGTPITALAVAAFPLCDYKTDVLKEVLRGAQSVLNTAGVALLGGHSLEDTELKFGLSVTGTVDKNKILLKSGAKEGDIIVLTKPLGIGIITTALKRKLLNNTQIEEAVKWMLTLNCAASVAALNADATSCTDVTGFGFTGHACNMLKEAAVNFVIDSGCVPVMDTAVELAKEGIFPGGAKKNLNFFSNRVQFSESIPEHLKYIFSDPQTSGGLLITIGKHNMNAFENSGVFYKTIGYVTKGTGILKIN